MAGLWADGLSTVLMKSLPRIRSAHTEDELEVIESEIDVLLRSEFDGLGSRQAALNLAAARLERLIRLQSDKLSASMRSTEPATG